MSTGAGEPVDYQDPPQDPSFLEDHPPLFPPAPVGAVHHPISSPWTPTPENTPGQQPYNPGLEGPTEAVPTYGGTPAVQGGERAPTDWNQPWSQGHGSPGWWDTGGPYTSGSWNRSEPARLPNHLRFPPFDGEHSKLLVYEHDVKQLTAMVEPDQRQLIPG